MSLNLFQQKVVAGAWQVEALSSVVHLRPVYAAEVHLFEQLRCREGEAKHPRAVRTETTSAIKESHIYIPP